VPLAASPVGDAERDIGDIGDLGVIGDIVEMRELREMREMREIREISFTCNAVGIWLVWTRLCYKALQ